MTFNWTVIDLCWATKINFVDGSFVFVTFLKYLVLFSIRILYIRCVIQKSRVLASFCMLKWNFDETCASPFTGVESPHVSMSCSPVGVRCWSPRTGKEKQLCVSQMDPTPFPLQSGPLMSVRASMIALSSPITSSGAPDDGVDRWVSEAADSGKGPSAGPLNSGDPHDLGGGGRGYGRVCPWSQERWRTTRDYWGKRVFSPDVN